ncbi:hypothetical protein FB451DRAFT_1372725 [Mycena latifolia]|nr:hypothetical protein FB451DRAFT_1372725 [Mycena latifolia]
MRRISRLEERKQTSTWRLTLDKQGNSLSIAEVSLTGFLNPRPDPVNNSGYVSRTRNGTLATRGTAVWLAKTRSWWCRLQSASHVVARDEEGDVVIVNAMVTTTMEVLKSRDLDAIGPSSLKFRASKDVIQVIRDNFFLASPSSPSSIEGESRVEHYGSDKVPYRRELLPKIWPLVKVLGHKSESAERSECCQRNAGVESRGETVGCHGLKAIRKITGRHARDAAALSRRQASCLFG